MNSAPTWMAIAQPLKPSDENKQSLVDLLVSRPDGRGRLTEDRSSFG